MTNKPPAARLLCLIACLLLLMGCAQDPTDCVDATEFLETISRNNEGEPFDRVEMLLPARLNIIQENGSNYDIELRSSSSLHPFITTEIENGKLTIGSSVSCFRNSQPLFLTIRMIDITAIEVVGTAEVITQVNPITANNLSLSVDGPGSITFEGTTNTLNASVIGSGSILANELVTAQADVAIVGSGNVEVNVTEQLTVDIEGSGSVVYSGNPEVTSNINGSGTVQQGN